MNTTRVSSRSFTGTPLAAAAARRFVRDTLTDWHLTEAADDAVLLTSELVTNAVIHAGTDVELTCRLELTASPAYLEIAVTDRYPTRAVPAAPAPDPGALESHGRGLSLTADLATTWGVTYSRAVKQVWFRMDIDDGPLHPAPAPPHDLDDVTIAVVTAGPDGRIRSWNGEAETMLGHAAADALGLPLAELAGMSGAGDRELSAEQVLQLGRWRGPATLRHRSGGQVAVYLSHVRTGTLTCWMIVAARHGGLLAESAAPARATRAVDVLDSDLPLPELLDAAARMAHLAAGGSAAYVLMAGTDGLLSAAAEAGHPRELPPLPAKGPFETDRPGPRLVDDLAESDPELAVRLGARSLACVPVESGGATAGFVVAVAAEADRFGRELVIELKHLADRLAVSVGRLRLAERERAQRGRLTFLAEAGELLAGVHDERLLAALTTQLVVPKIARWAAVYLTDQTGVSRLAQAWHADERRNAELRDSLPASLWSPGVGLPGVVAFPLSLGGEGLGTLVVSCPDRPLPQELRALVEDLCRHVSLNLHTARLYSRQTQTALVLQRSLLPMRTAPMPGVESAVIYLPAGEGAQAGGDFYDLFEVSGQWCFALGDVSGSGPEAAAVTGLARHAVRLFARELYPVADILDRLNRALLDEVEEGRFLSMLCGTLVPLPDGGARCTIASAGHPPPLLLRRHGRVEAVASAQLLLGVDTTATFFDETFEMAPDDVLVCVTDGVTERRDGRRQLDDNDGLARLLAQCRGLSAGAVAERVRQAVDAYSPLPIRDDMAVLVLRAKHPTPG
ncbi:SpoIIE family protein phosphatase [Nonomuraea soli]|uniref:Serine phosphatase RsbU (Regulator of sigma subunit)/anti-sigma regulatory factor (Ser/Thr protein kinase) n=1 Tax=Nonomuraea soli TaxID=1032476 RepID=A0A7W0CDB2_9ACTN|nr:SpoIIE family protein phosphatase [Nonomuraea soli]MBA2888917.1 serine phosphatase RsbU (regulator of sigma subunit)/anti-sigma regulatory factor (Ser/Thr protein kinase) [Nonomuraea soli]